MESHLQEGIAFFGNFRNGVFQQKTFRHNKNSGLNLGPNTLANFVFNNRFKCNIPVNIRDTSGNNSFFGNIEEPCKPNELPFEDCDGSVRDWKERGMADGCQCED